jgi:hypothetical protein
MRLDPCYFSRQVHEVSIPASYTLNWKSQSYFNVIKEIKAKMETLQQSGMRIELEWTPGHAEVQGNEIADRLPNVRPVMIADTGFDGKSAAFFGYIRMVFKVASTSVGVFPLMLPFF